MQRKQKSQLKPSDVSTFANVQYTKTQQDAIGKIQHFYRNYRQDKKMLVEKKKLLPPLEGVGPLPDLNSKKAEFETLFFNVKKKTPIFFAKRGFATLFPKDKDGNHKLNMDLFEDYLYQGIDTRRMVLEAYLREVIDKDTFISLSQIQEGVLEFCPNKKTMNTTESLRNYAIHDNGNLSHEANTVLLPYLHTYASPYALEEKNKQHFEKQLNTNLSQLASTANYFTLIELDIKQIFIITYYLLFYKMQGGVDQTIFDTKLKFATNIVDFVAKKLGIKNFEFNSSQTPAHLEALFNKLSQFILKMIVKRQEEKKKSEKEKNPDAVTAANFTEHMIKNMDFFSYLVFSIDEFIPILIDRNGNTVPAVLIINCQTQAAWLNAVTGIDPEKLVKKVPMFCDISVEQKNQLTQQGASPVGGSHPDLPPIPKEVHGALNRPYAYIAHDTVFHYKVLFYLRAFAEAVYQMQLQFVRAIRETTGQDKNYVINTILDFTASFYAEKFKGSDNIKTQIDNYAFFSTNEPNARFALLEYTLIVFCDMLKNREVYSKLFDQFPNQPKEQKQDIDFLLETLIPSKRILLFKNDLLQYSNSLGVFMCMMLIVKPKLQDIIPKLCAKLHTLEQQGLVKFKWNTKDGIMLNIDQESYRFRHFNKEKDYRYGRVYPDNHYIRKYSNDETWVDDLTQAINNKMEQRERPTHRK